MPSDFSEETELDFFTYFYKVRSDTALRSWSCGSTRQALVQQKGVIVKSARRRLAASAAWHIDEAASASPWVCNMSHLPLISM